MCGSKESGIDGKRLAEQFYLQLVDKGGLKHDSMTYIAYAAIELAEAFEKEWAKHNNKKGKINNE